MAYQLAPQLQQDCIIIANWSLCDVLLMNDAQYPWFILVPRVAQAKEIIDLSDVQQQQFWQESAKLSKLLQDTFNPDKLNVAALGNMVPQLHVHHIARFKSDPAWPKPVWGLLPAQPYTSEQIAQLKLSFEQQ